MSPREFFALLRRRRELREEIAEREKRSDYRAALIATAVLNAAGGKQDGQPFEVWDFFERPERGDAGVQALARE